MTVIERGSVSPALAALSELSDALDRVHGCDLSALSDDEVLTWAREVERLRRRTEALDQPLVSEVDRRNLAGRLLSGSSQRLLGPIWRVDPGTASARVRAARATSPRQALTGQTLPPVRPIAGRASQEGKIGSEHLKVLLPALDDLPDALPVADIEAAERVLVEAASSLEPRALRAVARRLGATIDPDGSYRDEADQQRRRYLNVTDAGDGMIRLSGLLDAACGALAQTVLHALSAPQPSEAAGTDGRTAGQRRHDGFRVLLRRAVSSGQLPTAGGVPATVLITMTAREFESRTGLAVTSYGQHLSVREALRLADEAGIAWVVHNSRGGVLNYGSTRRIASPGQTVALIARDQGCAFPDCPQPPEWTERHHVTPWSQGGRTDLNNLVLLCDHHHDRHEREGWSITMHDGVPWFTPPAWLDPQQLPRRHSRFADAPRE